MADVDVAGVSTSAPPAGPGKIQGRKRSLGALSFASIIDGFEGGLINTLFPVIRDSLGLATSALGIFAAISRFARMLMGPVWAGLADRFGRKKILFVATGLWGLWTIAAGFAQNFTQLLVLYSIGIIGTVAAEPITNGLVTDLFKRSERGRAFGTLRMIGAFGGVVGAPLLGQLANVEEGWRYGLIGMGSISVISGVLILIFVREPRKETSISADPEVRFNFRDARKLLKTPTIAFMATQVMLTTSLVLFAFLITFLVDVRGWTTADAAVVAVMNTLGMVFSAFIGGFIGDKMEKKFGAKGRVIFMQVYLVLYAVASFVVFQIDFGQGWQAYASLFCFGLIAGLGHPGAVLPIVGSVVPKNVTATAYALIFSFVQGAFAGVFSLTFGFLADALGLQSLFFWLITIPYAINAVFWTLMYRLYPRDLAKERERERVAHEKASIADLPEDQRP